MIVVFLLCLSGCDFETEEAKVSYSEPSTSEFLLSGKHVLRKMFTGAETSNSVSGGYFMFLGVGGGSAQSDTKRVSTVQFAWKMNDDTYAISSLPLEKIRIRFSDKATTPIIEFVYTKTSVHDLVWLMENTVNYAVVTIKESDWPTDVRLPMS